MGWNILRRTALTLLLITGSINTWVYADSAPMEPRKAVGLKDFSFTPRYMTPRQNQSAEKAWSIDIADDLINRPELSYWIEQWSSPDGLLKLNTAFSRSFAYRIPVDDIIRNSGIPWELTAIPVVESNWRIGAVSSSGAAGPWQFLESSGRGRKLVIDAWRDDRRDVWRSTEAAMLELAFYYRLYSDWLLAVASYNAGPTRIGNLRKENGLNGYWELLDGGVLPRETRHYVPQIIAVAYITAHSGRFGLPINWDMPTRWARIPLDRSIHLDNLSVITGLNRETIRLANQELNHPVTPPPTLPYSIKVPEEYGTETIKWLETLDESDAPERFWRYVVRSGDSLSAIAVKSGISMSELLSYNGHVGNGVLRIGERLYLPGDQTMPEGAEKDELPNWKGRYHVKAGDTFWSIAISFGIRPEILAEANHRTLNGVLLAGSVLSVPDQEEEL
jgi:membrane-bound lytic murein transglycosylase D